MSNVDVTTQFRSRNCGILLLDWRGRLALFPLLLFVFSVNSAGLPLLFCKKRVQIPSLLRREIADSVSSHFEVLLITSVVLPIIFLPTY
ncbi:hypothetical protein GCK32_016530 [Trichostrongylus colubriformis]|uniref:Uncharacterized protein n=1 Tax=Trichostrongylus colubriformis TaxID=6319 RepID=A0AAN8FS14_TRICO